MLRRHRSGAANDVQSSEKRRQGAASASSVRSAVLRSQGQPAQAPPVQFEQIKGVVEELVLPLRCVVPEVLEAGLAVCVQADDLAVEDGGATWEGLDGGSDAGKALGQVLAVTGEQADALAILEGQAPEPVKLQLVKPLRASRDDPGGQQEHRTDE
jgi:hypothetical protein